MAEQRRIKALTLFLGLVIVAFIILSYGYTIVVNDRYVLTEYLLAESNLQDAYSFSSETENYYSMASESYDYGQFEDVITYCELSRKSASSYVQEIRNIKAGINQDNRLMRTYVQILNEHIIIYNSLYEACEYFESAARCYENDDYSCGDINIEGHNEKIRTHDDAVNRNNEYLAQFNKVLKEVKAGDFNGIR